MTAFSDAHAVMPSGDAAMMLRPVPSDAASSLERAGQWPEAILLRIREGDPALISASIERHGFRAFDLGQLDAVRAALAAVPNPVLARNATALAIKAMVASLDDRFDLANSWFDMALAEVADDDRNAIVVRYGLDMVRRGRTDVVEFLIEEIKRAGLLEADAAQLWALLATAYVGARRMDDARGAARRALGRLHAVHDDAVRARIFHQAAFVALNDGDRTSAKDLALRALEHAAAGGLYEIAARALSVLHNLSIGAEDDPVAARAYLVRMAEYARASANPALALYATMNMYELETDAGNLPAIALLDDELAELRIFLTPMASESLLPAQALRAAWEGRFEHAHSLLAPSAEKQFDDDRRAMRWAEVAAYAAAAGLRPDSARAITKSRAALRRVDAADRAALRAQAFLTIAEILLAHDGRARSLIAGMRVAIPGAGPRFAALLEAVRALFARWTTRSDGIFSLPRALERLERVELGGIARFIEALSLPTSPQARVALLSELEIKILRRVAAGETSREIAVELERSPQTVDVHVRTICRKLACSGRRRAVVYALGAGLVHERRQSPKHHAEGPPLVHRYPVAGSAPFAPTS